MRSDTSVVSYESRNNSGRCGLGAVQRFYFQSPPSSNLSHIGNLGVYSVSLHNNSFFLMKTPKEELNKIYLDCCLYHTQSRVWLLQ